MKSRIMSAIGLIKAKVLFFLCCSVLLFMISNIYSIYHNSVFEKKFDGVLSQYYMINSFLIAYSDNVNLYEQYLDDKTESNWISYISNDENVKQLLNEIIADAEFLSMDSYLLIQSIKNMYVTCNRMIHTYFPDTEEEEKLLEIQEVEQEIEKKTRELLQISLTYGMDTSDEIKDSIQIGRQMSFSLMVFVTMASAVFASLMVNKVLNPILQLSKVAEELEREQFDIPDLVVEQGDEIGNLNRAFNNMKDRMRTIICELKENQELSKRLYEQEIHIMNSEKLLEKAKLSFLQSQINPHFLFNTLNVIAGMAKVEQAKITNELILSLSRLFRYTLDNKAEIVKLSQELTVIKNYIYIEKKRFGGRLNYLLKADLDLDAYYIPPFTLQPIIENSIRHGILEREKGGMVAIKIFIKNKKLVIRIIDNGVGIDKEKKHQLEKSGGEKQVGGEISGIGIHNVFGRLQLIYSECEFKITSKVNRGTCIEIKIPEEECCHDKAVSGR